MSCYQPVGSVFGRTCQHLAAVVADTVLEFRSPRAVTLDPEGRVYVEPVDHAAEVDIVGVYTPSLGVLELTRRISEDLAFEKTARGLKRPHRRAV